jgi:hypothetical protein
MSVVPRGNAAIGADWPDLIAEFDDWGEAGRVAKLWWRDDDAVAPSPELASLLRLAGDVPLALAVIPAEADPELPGFLQTMPRVAVMQHGWRHANHAGIGMKKSEFPAGRPAATVARELAEGHARLAELFGSRALPILVPPWNRFDAGFVPLLTNIGILGLSSMASRKAPPLPAGLVRMDVHVDLVAWKDGRRFVGSAAAVGGLVEHLRAYRLGPAEPATPVGILTHHLIMDGATTGFVDRLIAIVERHQAARWTSPAELLAR